MAIQSFPFGIPFSSSYAISASYGATRGGPVPPTASLAEFITGFYGPTGPNAITVNRSGFEYLQSATIQYIGSSYNV